MSREVERFEQEHLAVMPSAREDGAIEIQTEGTILVISGDLDHFIERVREAAEMAERERDERACARCGDEVLVLNSRDECAGCEEDREREAVMAGELWPSLTPQRKAAIVHAGRIGHVWRYVPGSRFTGLWEPGKFHYKVIDWLAENGVLTFQEGWTRNGISYGGGYALTSLGEALYAKLRERSRD